MMILAVILCLLSIQPQPIIARFSADITSITPEDAESGVYPITLNWQTLRMDDEHTLHLEVFVLDRWINALPEDASPLPASGSLEHTVPHTLSFLPPSFRLVIRDADGEIVTTRALIIPYRYDVAPDLQPDILDFEATSRLYANLLETGNAVVDVHWEVAHRPPNSNLVFEQIMPDEQTINVEFPRGYLWVRSEGDGVVQPINPGDDIVWLRLSLVDVDSGIVYDIQETPVEILPAPRLPAPQPTRTPSTEPEIIRFSANTLNALPGDLITLTWETRRLNEVTISTDDVLFSALPPSGSLEFSIPVDYTAETITFILMASESVTVSIIQETP